MLGLGRAMHLMMSAGTLVVGLLLALVFAAGTEFGPFGWMLAVLGAIGVVAWLVLPQPGRR